MNGCPKAALFPPVLGQQLAQAVALHEAGPGDQQQHEDMPESVVPPRAGFQIEHQIAGEGYQRDDHDDRIGQQQTPECPHRRPLNICNEPTCTPL